MSWILNLETATAICSVAIARDGIPVAMRETSEEKAHAARLTTFISECLKEAGIDFSGLDAVAVSIGPGSYTGLRIGIATAKGLCYALDKPLIAVNTLQSLAAGWYQSGERAGLVCPMLDARRMEVYTAVFDSTLNEVLSTRPLVIENQSYSEILNNQIVTFIGDGMPKSKPLLKHQINAKFDEATLPSAGWMAKLSFERFQNGKFEDLAASGPLYLKEFMSTVPKKAGF